MDEVKEDGIANQLRTAKSEITMKSVTYSWQVNTGRYIVAVAVFLTVMVLWLLLAPNAKFVIDTEDEVYDTDETSSFDVTRDVRQSFCEIFSVAKKNDVAIRAGDSMCFPRETGTVVTDLQGEVQILGKTSPNYCVKCCFAHVFLVNSTLRRSRCYPFSTIRSLSVPKVHMIQTTCKDLCGFKKTKQENLKSEDTLALHPMLTIPEKIKKKMKYWDTWTASVKEINKRRKIEEEQKILKIILVNLDGLSRQNVHNILPDTMKRLNKSGFMEMKGFSHISPEPATNLLASLTGLKPRDWDTVCSFSKNRSIDKCPFIWKRLSALQYITSYVQDASIFGASKIRTYGHREDFHRSPVDYFLEHSLYKSVLTEGSQDCKNALSIRTLLEFSERVIKKFSKYPLFSMTRITNSNHSNSKLDLDYKLDLFFQEIENVFEDSLVAFYSNQGYGSSAAILRIMPGGLNRFEPFLFLRVPQKYEYEGLKGNLKLNRDRLTTMYDFYKTLNHVGRITCMTTQPQEKNESECFQPKTITKREVGSSLFLPISPYRNCSDAQIPEEVCPCGVNPLLVSEKYRHSSNFLNRVGGIVLGKLNSLIPSSAHCSIFVLKWVDKVIPIREPIGKNQVDFLVRILVGVLDNKLEMAVEQRVRTDKTYDKIKTIGSPVWASKNRGNGPKCLRSSSKNFLDKLFCVCKS